MTRIFAAVRQSARSILKRPAYAAACVFTLALGIGANTAIFSVVNAVLLRQLPFAHADRAVWITSVRPQRSDAPFSLPDFIDYHENIRSLDSISAVGVWSASLTGRGEAERFNGLRISANYFETLGVAAAIGRTLQPQDDLPGAPRVVVITYGLWQRRFGADASLIGRRLDLSGSSYTVVGVLPPDFFFPIYEAELAVPLVPDADPARNDRNTVNFLRLAGRLAPGATLGGAQSEMNALAARLRQEFPESNAQKLGIQLTPLRDQITGGFRSALWALLAAVGFVLLIACANLANLNFVRGATRRREISIRTALGASRWRITKQLLLESILLSAAGGAIGILFARFGLRALIALAPSTIPRRGEIHLDSIVLIFTGFISFAAAILTGLAPAISASRVDLAVGLNEASRGSTEGSRGKALRQILVTAEVALSMILLSGAGVLLRSFARFESAELGFEARGLLSVRLSLPPARYPHVADVSRFRDALFNRLQEVPGISVAGATHVLPLGGTIASIPFSVVGRSITHEQFPDAQYRMVSPEFLRAMRIRLDAGREFRATDNAQSRLVCYVNESLARRYWPSSSALGAHLLLDDNNSGPRQAEIVGIIRDVKDRGPDAPPSFDIYIPIAQTHEDDVDHISNNQYWLLRTAGDPMALADSFREAVHKVDPGVAVSDTRSMAQYYAALIVPRRFNLQLFSIFAAAALCLALAGIYGVISYSVNLRSHEIGIRLAIGAQHGNVLRMIFADGMKPVVLGITLGLAGIVALSKELASLLFNVKASDPQTLLLVIAIFLAVSLAAIYAPARRATRIDALAVLRGD